MSQKNAQADACEGEAKTITARSSVDQIKSEEPKADTHSASASPIHRVSTMTLQTMQSKIWAVAQRAAVLKDVKLRKAMPDVDLTRLFASPENQQSPEMVKFFWTELKRKLIRKYGNLEKAFRSVDFSADGSINFYEFSQLMKTMNISLNLRFCRLLFDKASGNDKALSYDEFLNTLMASTLEKMAKHMKQIETNTHQVHGHVNAFMQRLVFATEENKSAACDRFQRKLTKKVVKAFWTRCRKFTMQTGKRLLDVKQFIGLMKLCRNFMAHEEQFLTVLHSEVDRTKSGTVSTVDMVTACVLMTDWVQKEQLAFLFWMFDFDCDDCLSTDQILILYTSVLIYKPIIMHNKTVSEGNEMFNDELALQEARRLFHLTMDSLDLADGARSLVNLEELNLVFVRYPFMLDSMLPGMNNCRWLLKERSGKVEGQRPTPTLPPVHGTTEASTFRRDISKTFLSIMREEPTEFHPTSQNWSDVHRDTFQSWASKACEEGPTEQEEDSEETTRMTHSLSTPVITLARQKIANLAIPMQRTKTLAALPNLKSGLPEIADHRFGAESVPRFLMYSAAKTSWLRHQAPKEETIPYRCSVCSSKTVADYHDIRIGGND